MGTDLRGRRFGRLLVIEKADKGLKGQARWSCLCDCGNTKVVYAHHLKAGRSKTCGCRMRPSLVGQRFGKWLVVEEAPRSKQGHLQYLCECECGKRSVVYRTHLISGQSGSCGCTWRRKGKDHPSWKGYEGISGTLMAHLRSCAGEKKRGRELEFELTPEFLWELYEVQGRRCALSGLPIVFATDWGRKKHREEQTASLDRIDNDKGYVEDNVQWLHKDVNWMKGTFDQARFRLLCMSVASYSAS